MYLSDICRFRHIDPLKTFFNFPTLWNTVDDRKTQKTLQVVAATNRAIRGLEEPPEGEESISTAIFPSFRNRWSGLSV